MLARDFCFWLQGHFEIEAAKRAHSDLPLTLDTAQVEVICKHLALVFKHDIDPSMGPKPHQEKLNAIHHPKTTGPLPPTDSNGTKMRC